MRNPVGAMLLAALAIGGVPAANAAPILQIQVNVYLTPGLVIPKGGVRMGNWVDEGQVRDTILPEVNRIWRQADIQFVLGTVERARLLNPHNRESLASEIAGSHRNQEGRSDPERIGKLGELIDLVPTDGRTVNVYLAPYLGETSQGHTRPGQLRVFVAQWSDKASHARSAPERFALTEPLPFRKGSMSRTLSHELGHIFGLAHPARSHGVTGLLMGGAQAGYDLTAAEIETARAAATEIAQGRARTRRRR